MKKILIVFVITALLIAFFALDFSQYLDLGYVKGQQTSLQIYFSENPLKAGLIYIGIYILITALSLPGAAIMTLVGGAIFGLLWGTVFVSIASTIGATLAFLVSRLLLKDFVQNKFGDSLQAVNRGIEKDGALYLFMLRLVPAFPFFVINLVMGLTSMRSLTFFFVSQIGMLPGTLVYVNAGTEIGKIDSLSGILSPALIVSFVLLGIFPLLAKKAIAGIKNRKIYALYPKPLSFDRNLVVIGAGSGGLVSAYIAAAVKAKVTLIEKNKMGGDCLNTGCVPSKALIRSAKFINHIKRAQEFGCKSASVNFEFAEIMERVQRIVKAIEPHDSVERYTGLGVECIRGEAKITSPYHVEVNGQTLKTRNIVVATGGTPFAPPIPGIENMDYLTSDTIWSLRTLPKRLVILGGGPIGCELTQCFARFGSKVTQVEMFDRLLPREDPEISEALKQRFIDEGIDVRLDHKATAFKTEAGRKTLVCEHQGDSVRIEFDALLVTIGRAANTKGFGLEELGIEIASQGTVEVNEYLQTRFPNIYAVGDVAGPYQFTHTAAHQAWYASVNALFGAFKKFRVDYSVIPWCTFTDPEIARVGLNEQEATERGIAYEVSQFDIAELDRAIADSEAHGVVKVLTVPGKDKILGATIVGDHAGDLISEYVSGMRHKLGMNKILSTIHIYPTLAEANKYTAGEWKRAHAPKGVLHWVERWHRWRLGRSANSTGE